MTNTGIRIACVFAIVAAAAPHVSRAQGNDTVPTDSEAERLGLWARTSRSSGLVLSSGKTYNRVEGLPVMLGPVLHDSIQSAELNVSVMGIIRSAEAFHWDSQNLGHRINADFRVGRGRGYGLSASSYDIVTPIEPWQLPDPDRARARFSGTPTSRVSFTSTGGARRRP